MVRAGAAAAADGSGLVRERGDGGDFTVGELGGKPSGVLGAADIAVLPRDPDALVRRIKPHPVARARPTKSTSSTRSVDCSEPVLCPRICAPPGTRRWRACPDVVVTEEQASLDGRTGAAIGLPAWSATEQRDVIIDPTDGTYLGERSIQTRGREHPAGTVIDSVAVHVTPVDDEP